MKLFVILKQVPDTETKIKISGNGIDESSIKWIVSPYDEFAIEEALKTKESGGAETVTALTLGPARCVDALRTALAMGCDAAVHINTETAPNDTHLVAKALAESLKKEGAQMVFSGKQAIDDDQSATFGYLAEFLDWPSASVVTEFKLSDDKKTARATREIEGGTRQIIEMPVPCVVAVTKGINTPRYASLPGIMKAKKKEIKAYSLADLGLADESPKVSESDYQLPPERSAGKLIDGDAATQAKELVRLLREEAKVI